MTVNVNSNLSVSRFFSRGEKSDQKVTKFGGDKKQDFVKCLKMNLGGRRPTQGVWGIRPPVVEDKA